MDPSDLGQLNRLIKLYGPNIILRNLTLWCVDSNSLFLEYLDGLGREEERVYRALRRLEWLPVVYEESSASSPSSASSVNVQR